MKERIFTCQEHGLLTKENSYVHRAGDKYRWRCKKCEFAKAAIRRANKINVPCDIHGLTDRDSLGRCRKCRVVESVNYKKNNREIVRANFKKNYYKDLDKSRISNRVKNKNLTKPQWIEMTSRSTNLHRDRTALAYLVNRYPQPYFEDFFETRDVPINQDHFAISEMIQWVFRSAIRDQKPISIYIPSERMRSLFVKWLDGKEPSF